MFHKLPNSKSEFFKNLNNLVTVPLITESKFDSLFGKLYGECNMEIMSRRASQKWHRHIVPEIERVLE